MGLTHGIPIRKHTSIHDQSDLDIFTHPMRSSEVVAKCPPPINCGCYCLRPHVVCFRPQTNNPDYAPAVHLLQSVEMRSGEV